ncbi:LysR family transcriptional regulator [Succinatimonas hippei]|uniref:LysR family transcriptional regulator n=1 Tax=Succinatimonas hippei TaxID=626938 RepID=UPI002013A868|nr:LysR family transcriptional regulator [Succinatimonas hippei]MCL1602542.1 LysR family transcriptional regulator [Succinatimonas hippei]MDM8119405.1 LysR family transcriptional regulator [Succinatimonas hippei]
MDFNFNQLQAFVLAAKLGSFSQTARHMGKAQSVISGYIRDLEDDLNYQLFKRGHKIELTERGALLLKHVKKLVEDGEIFYERAMALHDTTQPSLHFGIDFSIYNAELFHVLRQYAEAFPHLALRLSPISSFEVKELMLEYDLDVALYFNHNETLPFNFSHLRQVPNRIIVGKNHPLAAQKEITRDLLAKHRQIVICSNLSRDAKGITVSPNAWEVDNYYYALSLVSHNVGFAIVPELLTDLDYEFTKSIIALNDDNLNFPDATLSLVWKDGLSELKHFNFLKEKICKAYSI